MANPTAQTAAEIQAEIARLEARIAAQTAARQPPPASTAPASMSSAPLAAPFPRPLNPMAAPFTGSSHSPYVREYSLHSPSTQPSPPYGAPPSTVPPTAKPPPAPTGPSSYRGSWNASWSLRGRGRGKRLFSSPSSSSFYPRGSSRGRGRGGAPLPSRHRTLVLNHNASDSSPATAPTPSSASSTPAATPAPGTTGTTTPAQPAQPTQQDNNWVKRKTTHNMSLVRSDRYEQTEPARLAAMEASAKAKAAAAAATRPTKPSKKMPSVRRGDKMGEIIIDGIVFQFDETGEKMIKKGPVQAQQPDSSITASTATAPGEQAMVLPPSASSTTDQLTPSSASFEGQQFVRTKTGNLISKELLASRKESSNKKAAAKKAARLAKLGEGIAVMQRARNDVHRVRKGTNLTTASKTLCTFFQKTGQCKRGLSCPFVHDQSKVAICPGALTPKGCQKGSTCHLSHTRDEHRVPDCTHFLAGNCRFSAEECIYTHSDAVKAELAKRDEAKEQGQDPQDQLYCRDFATYGWCDHGSSCPRVHSFDCPDFAETGKCDRPNCRLAHVIRAQSDVLTSTHDHQHDGSDDKDDGDALFTRDDAAATGTKRSAPSSDDEEDDEDAEAQEGEAVPAEHQTINLSSLLSHRTKRRKGAKEFANQQSFIGFDDEVPQEEESGSEEEESDVDTHSEDESNDEDEVNSDEEEQNHEEEGSN